MAVCTYYCWKLRSGSLLGIEGAEPVIRGSVLQSVENEPNLSDIRRSTRKIDACTDTHINLLYACTGKINREQKQNAQREPPVFARKGQNGGVQTRAPAAEARSHPGPVSTVQRRSREDQRGSIDNFV